VNGRRLDSKDGTLLKPNDRLIFGTNSVFLFKDATSKSTESLPDPDDDPVTWEHAQKECSDLEDAASKKGQEEMLKRQEEEAKAKMDELRKQQEVMRLQMQKEYEEKLAKLQKQADGEE
jgi:hypothetical protein